MEQMDKMEWFLYIVFINNIKDNELLITIQMNIQSFFSYPNEDFIDYLSKMLNTVQSNKKYLLNTHNNKLNVLEKYIYDIIKFHIPNTENGFIEFYLNTETNNIHIECDKKELYDTKAYTYPEFSCLTYFSDNSSPTIFTNYDVESYKYKTFDENNEFYICFPEKYKQIIFDPKKYYGTISFNNELSNILIISYYNTEPLHKNYYEHNTRILFGKRIINSDISELKKQSNNIILDNSILNSTFFENALYKNKYESNDKLSEYFNKIELYANKEKPFELKNTEKQCDYNITIENNSLKQVLYFNNMKEKYGSFIDDIYEINIHNNLSITNRFYKKSVLPNILNDDICEWVISECMENNDLKRNKTNQINLNNIQSVKSFFVIFFKRLFFKVKNMFSSCDGYEVKDFIFVKQDSTNTFDLKENYDLSLCILLNDTQNVQGGGFTFENDNKTFLLEKGDMLLYHNKNKINSIGIEKGELFMIYITIKFLL